MLAAHLGGGRAWATIWVLMIMAGVAFLATGYVLARTAANPVRAALLWTANPLLIVELVTAGHLDIILRPTAQLQANPEALAAFERAAATWENLITTEITVVVDVDYGTTRFFTTSSATGAFSYKVPLTGLPGWLSVLTRIDPLTYVVGPMRHAVFTQLPLPPIALHYL